ncbi:uncharacterized protein LOC104864579 [Fukomys damarensis]|uniref:uncharacterized protein LOC104864579 n=1 Tax=Fukomys damarensis TaxID=885580 RepID=UPI0008FEBBFD|nr:uncharacterized protein LOC104864579 [Fukomys damarensis]
MGCQKSSIHLSSVHIPASSREPRPLWQGTTGVKFSVMLRGACPSLRKGARPGEAAAHGPADGCCREPHSEPASVTGPSLRRLLGNWGLCLTPQLAPASASPRLCCASPAWLRDESFQHLCVMTLAISLEHWPEQMMIPEARVSSAPEAGSHVLSILRSASPWPAPDLLSTWWKL